MGPFKRGDQAVRVHGWKSLGYLKVVASKDGRLRIIKVGNPGESIAVQASCTVKTSDS